MSSNQQLREELDARARRGETVIPGGTGGRSLEAQEHLAEGILHWYRLFDKVYKQARNYEFFLFWAIK
jgi:hypothetical protein